MGPLGAIHRNGGRLRVVLVLLHSGAVAASGNRPNVQADLSLPAQQVVLRRALRLAVRQTDHGVGSPALEGR